MVMGQREYDVAFKRDSKNLSLTATGQQELECTGTLENKRGKETMLK
jgi:hypothetical protein